MSKGVMTVLGGLLIFLLLGAMLTGLVSFRASSTSDYYVVNSGVTEANVTLALDVLDNDKSNIAVSSNMTADAPLRNTYTASSRVLNVTGLDSSTTRKLTVTYYTPRLTQYLGVDTAARLWPLYVVLATLAIIAGAIYGAFRRE